MIHNNTIATYQEVLLLNNEMLRAAEAGNNHVFFELVRLCNQAIGSIQKSNPEPLNQSQVEIKITCLQQLLAQDAKISRIMNSSIERYLS
jgi:hypothetical protein